VEKRLFIAVDIDETTRAQVGRLAAEVRAAVEPYAKASWVRPDRMHLTLHFLGNVDDAFEQRVRRTFAHPIPIDPFAVAFHGFGIFPERGSPRVLWLGIANGLEQLRCLHGVFVGLDSSRALPQPPTESFTPHLTLARFRDRVSRSSITGIARIPASAGPTRIDRVTLYESRLSPAGPSYIPLAEAQLTRSR
jgi:2'-5' RNA ligase